MDRIYFYPAYPVYPVTFLPGRAKINPYRENHAISGKLVFQFAEMRASVKARLSKKKNSFINNY